MGLEFQGSVTSGVVSALNRTLGDGDARIKLVQIDAAINPGNSGGALVNMDGKVIGINSAKIVANGVEGIGLAIPSNAVQNVISAIMEKGYVPRPYLGVSIFDQQSAASYGYQLNLKKGVYIFQVVPGGPADQAGLLNGDVITAIDGAEVNSVSDLRAKIAEHSVGDKVELTIQRGGQERKASLTLEEMPKGNCSLRRTPSPETKRPDSPSPGESGLSFIYYDCANSRQADCYAPHPSASATPAIDGQRSDTRPSAGRWTVGVQEVDVIVAPRLNAREHRLELPPDLRQAVLHARRHLRIDRAAHDALTLERLELRRQRRMRNPQLALELVETARALTQLMQHEDRPLPLQDLLRRHERADAK